MESYINRLNNSGKKFVIAVTGGGVGAVSALTSVAGASKSLLEATVPYSREALGKYLENPPERSCSPDVAADLALCALKRARGLLPSGPHDLLGVGATCSLTTDPPRLGENRCFVSVVGSNVSIHRGLVLNKGERQRPTEEAVASQMILSILMRAVGIEQDLPLDLRDDERLFDTTPDLEFWVSRLESGRAEILMVSGSGEVVPELPDNIGVLPGSYNPLHKGHLALIEAASAQLDAPVVPEISLLNVDKPALSLNEVLCRVRQFQSTDIVVITCAATFLQKARLFPGTTFVIGEDTADRLITPRYYGGSADEMRKALAEMDTAGCRFLVAGRVAAGGVFRTLADVSFPEDYARMFTALPEEKFRLDLSSSEIRDL